MNLNEMDGNDLIWQQQIVDEFLGRISETKSLWNPDVLSFLGIRNENQIYFLEHAKKWPFRESIEMGVYKPPNLDPVDGPDSQIIRSFGDDMFGGLGWMNVATSVNIHENYFENPQYDE